MARGGLGPKTLGGNQFYKGHREITEKPHITFTFFTKNVFKKPCEKASTSL
jgi:hypothetical protein